MQIPLVATKLMIPPIQRELVPRQRLIERLNQGLRGKLILVSSPAGYGKTSLLSEWASQCLLPVAWITLDEGDNDLARFLAYLAAALGKVVPLAGEHAALMPHAQQISAPEQVMAGFVNALAATEQPFILVLDDYHLIHEPSVHKALGYLLDHLPQPAHLVIASRADPPLPLARLRARSQLAELRLADLCFTQSEAALFLNDVMQTGLGDEQVATLTGRTEGWIAGLQMAAISLRGAASKPDYVRAFSGSNRFILDYLGEEVLDSQPQAVQDFLMKTSILERLSGPLCDAVCSAEVSARASGSQEMLERLERDNLFIIPLDEERSWYRYHQLFLDLLRKRAQQRFAADLPAWHKSAGLWLAQNGDLEGAFRHAAAAEDFEWAADLLEQAAQPVLMRSEFYTFRNFASQLPESVLRARPNLVLFHAWVTAIGGGTPEAVEMQLGWLDPHAEGTRGKTGVIRAYLLFSQGKMDSAFNLVRQSLEDMPSEEGLFRGIAYYLLSISSVMDGQFESGVEMLEKVVATSLEQGRVLLAAGALCNLSEVHQRLGRLQAAREDYEKVLAIARDEKGRYLPIAGKALFGLSDLWREWNDLDQAEAYYQDGAELVKYLQETILIAGAVVLARIRQAREDAPGAQAAIHTAAELAQKTLVTSLDDQYVRMYRAEIDLQQGNLEAVGRWVKEQGLAAALTPADLDQKENFYKFHLLKYELLVYARWLIASNDPGQALFWLKEIEARMQQQGRARLQMETLLLMALAHQNRGDAAPALDCFARALELAQPGGYVRLFLDLGLSIRPLLQAAREAASEPSVQAYAGRLLAALDLESPGEKAETPQGGLVEPLTGREIELLALIAAGLSNQEIAERLFISLPTVKWHTGNIFGKLSARSRTQAVARARTLGILPEG